MDGRLTTKDVAEKLAVTMREVQMLIQRGKLPAEKFGRDWVVKETDLLQYLQDRPKRGRPRKQQK